ncbi:hypothetical protein niasHT_035711 [Heterodera trifolii]|uniref:Golgin subfamily A conserved domain-containing protein n=1 Tax=Heterodera trifolii TaxID=157864 RepID=A0ABD2HUL7_9BILA
MSANEEDEKMSRARVLLRKFQTKQSRRSSLNESDSAVLGVNVDLLDNASSATESSTDFLSPKTGGGGFDESSQQSVHSEEGTFSHQSSHGSTPVSAKTETTAPNETDNALKMFNNHDQRLPPQQIDKCHSLQKIAATENEDITALQIALAHKQQEFNELQSKHRELHSHYAELHSAYGVLAEQHGQHKTGLEQIQQLRMALSVALEEKMSTQNELREVKLVLEKSKENEAIGTSSSALPGNQQHLSDSAAHYEMEQRLKRLVAERDHLLGTVASQSSQIEQQRRECSSLEAKIVLMQQDRIDAQGRIKSLYATKAQLEQSIEQQRSELTMRDIYIKQLTRQTANNTTQFEKCADAIGQQNVAHQQSAGGGGESTQNQQEIRQKLDDDLKWHRNKVLELQKQLQLVQEQQQTENAQANANAKKLVEQLDSVKAQNAELETFNNVLEERLRILQQKLFLNDNSPPPSNNNKNIENAKISNSADGQQNLPSETEHLSEMNQLMKSVTELTAENEKLASKLCETEQLVQQKEHSLYKQQQSLADAQSRIAQLEQLQNIQATINEDVSLLAAQLQNEKATVSRAVAQNLELKSQLKELQDRLIAVINESAAKEDERTNAMATVERLTKQLLNANEGEEGKRSEGEEEDELKTNDSDHLGTEEEPIPGQTVRHTATTTTASTMTEATVDSFTNTNASSCDVGLQTDSNERDTNASVRHFAVDASSPLAADAIPPTGEQPQQQPRDKGENGTQIETTRAIGHQQHGEKAEEGTTTNNLATQMEALCRENALYRRTNERLEYWLTALESENESIGEYIALYRFQRTQIQQRIAEKDAALQQLQQQNTQLTAILTELRNAMLAIMQKSDANAATTLPTATAKLSMDNCSAITEGNEHSDCANPTDQQKQQIHPPPMDQLSAVRLMRILERSEVISRQVTCMAANQAQIHCTGCVECQGELFNI